MESLELTSDEDSEKLCSKYKFEISNSKMTGINIYYHILAYI